MWFNCVESLSQLIQLGIEITELQEDTELKRESLQMLWWNKYTFSVHETAEYFGFSDKKVRKIIDEHENESFILWNGTSPRIKRKLFGSL